MELTKIRRGFRQWGEWVSAWELPNGPQRAKAISQPGRIVHGFGGIHAAVYRVGKKAAGRLLVGREHNEFPAVAR